MQFVCFREGQFQVVQNILGGKYASGEMLLQLLNFIFKVIMQSDFFSFFTGAISGCMKCS